MAIFDLQTLYKNNTNFSFVKTGRSQSSLVLYCDGLLGFQRDSPPKNENAVIGSLTPTCHSNPVWFLYLPWSFFFNAAQKKLKSDFQKKDKVTPSDQFLKKAEPYAVKQKARKLGWYN